ncbi:MAG: hypothetical protein EZS28_015421 [Streblomastix strix]|uniref:Uncharacterized protein n=1 Tax=Streblomastix strix TaxID=222440 RepID=A0A5J4W2B0_9EUKA|nr:MAG: hypothetical protein EZS28_015421 [Streblomastix strix]
MEAALAAYIWKYLQDSQNKSVIEVHRGLASVILQLAKQVEVSGESIRPFFAVFLAALQEQNFSHHVLCCEIIEKLFVLPSVAVDAEQSKNILRLIFSLWQSNTTISPQTFLICERCIEVLGGSFIVNSQNERKNKLKTKSIFLSEDDVHILIAEALLWMKGVKWRQITENVTMTDQLKEKTKHALLIRPIEALYVLGLISLTCEDQTTLILLQKEAV